MKNFTERQQKLIEWNIDNRFDLALEGGTEIARAWKYANAFDFQHYIENLPSMVDVNRIKNEEIAKLYDEEYNQNHN